MNLDREMLESITVDRLKWLSGCGFTGMNYPRWDSIRYAAAYYLDIWNYSSGSRTPAMARFVIAMQPFSGIKQEWVERNMKWN